MNVLRIFNLCALSKYIIRCWDIDKCPGKWLFLEFFEKKTKYFYKAGNIMQTFCEAYLH